VIYGYIADFYCHAAGLIIEVDGRIHEQQRDYDSERDQGLSMYDLRVIRFTNEEVLNTMPTVLNRIAAVIDDRVDTK
jgi:very-short-patch-repair endonuclease